jgi:hypothetical protein
MDQDRLTQVIAVTCVAALVGGGCGSSSDDPVKTAAAPAKAHSERNRADSMSDLSEAQSILIELQALFQKGTSGDCSVLPEVETKLKEYDRVLDRLAKSDLDLAGLRANRLDLESEYAKAVAYCDVAN